MLQRAVINGINPRTAKSEQFVGGVVQHTNNLEGIRELTDVDVEFQYVECDVQWVRKLFGSRVRLADYVAAIWKALTMRATPNTVIHFNPSLYPNAAYGVVIQMAIAKWRGFPTLLQIHGGRLSDVPEGSLSRRLWLACLDKATLLGIFPGPQWEEMCAAGYESKMRETYSLLPPTPKPVDQSGGPARFIIHGRLVPSKGMLETIEAFEKVYPDLPDATLTIAGAGPLYDQITARIAQSPAKSAIHFEGFMQRADLDATISSCNIFVLPTRHTEGFPLSFLEGAERGLVPIVTSNSAIPKLFDAGEEFIALDVSDPEDLVRCMREVGKDAELRQRVGPNARAKVHKLCTIAEAGKTYLQLYEEALHV